MLVPFCAYAHDGQHLQYTFMGSGRDDFRCAVAEDLAKPTTVVTLRWENVEEGRTTSCEVTVERPLKPPPERPTNLRIQVQRSHE